MNTLYTLGYTGAKPEQILKLVQDLGALVVDCRYSPRSRAVQWTGAGFRRLLGESYLHLPSLGNINYKGDGPIQINKPAEGVPQVIRLLDQQPVILLCVCAECETCHRKVVAELVQAASGCAVQHLNRAEISAPSPTSTSQPAALFPQADFSAAPLPRPTDAGGQLTLSSKALPLHQLKMF